MSVQVYYRPTLQGMESERIRFVCPGEMPARSLAANQRTGLGWAAQGREVRGEKRRWYDLLVPAVADAAVHTTFPWQRVSVMFIVRFKDRRRHDADGLVPSLKPILDVLCMASGKGDNTWRLGVLQDDDCDLVVDYTVRIEKWSDTPGTEIIVERR